MKPSCFRVAAPIAALLVAVAFNSAPAEAGLLALYTFDAGGQPTLQPTEVNPYVSASEVLFGDTGTFVPGADGFAVSATRQDFPPLVRVIFSTAYGGMRIDELSLDVMLSQGLTSFVFDTRIDYANGGNGSAGHRFVDVPSTGQFTAVDYTIPADRAMFFDKVTHIDFFFLLESPGTLTIDNLRVEGVAVPEPSTCAMAAIAVAAMSLWTVVRRRKASRRSR
jgi:hypothetical protein